MIFAIVWGSIVFVGQNVAQSLARSQPHTSAQQVNTVVKDYHRSDTAIATASSASSSCTTVACLRASHLDAASKLTRFDNDLRTMSLPANASQPAQLVESDTTQLSSILSQLANSSDLSTLPGHDPQQQPHHDLELVPRRHPDAGQCVELRPRLSGAGEDASSGA